MTRHRTYRYMILFGSMEYVDTESINIVELTPETSLLWRLSGVPPLTRYKPADGRIARRVWTRLIKTIRDPSFVGSDNVGTLIREAQQVLAQLIAEDAN